MGLKPEYLYSLAVFVPLAAVVLWLLVRKGCLARNAVADAPKRNVILTPIDLAISFVSFIVGSIVIGMVMHRLGYEQPAEGQSIPPETLAALAMAMHALQLFIVLFLLIRTEAQPRGWRELGLVPRAVGREIKLGLLALPAAIVLVMGVSSIVVVASAALGFEIPKTGHDMLRVMNESGSAAITIVLLLSAVVFAPLFEEIIFRGLVQTALQDFFGSHRWFLVFACALLFTLIHLSSVAWQSLPGLFVLGVMLGWLYEKTGSLLPPILLHVGFNALNSGYSLLVGPGAP